MVSQLLSVLADSTSGFGEQIISALHRLQCGQHLLQTSRIHESHYTEMHPWNLATFFFVVVVVIVANCEPLARNIFVANCEPLAR